MSETEKLDLTEREQRCLAAIDNAVERGLITDEDRERLLELLRPLLEKKA